MTPSADMANVVELRPSDMFRRVDQAFSAAEVAALSSYTQLRETAALDERGCIRDTSGYAFVYVNASRSLKKLLVMQELVVPNHGLRLLVKGFHVPDQSLSAQEAAVRAAAAVLNRHIGDLGWFSIESRMD